MKKLDLYILKKFLSTFFFTALIFTIIAVVIDYSEKIEDFYKDEIPLDLIINMHYIPFIPFINAVLWPLFALIAVIFFTSRMAYNSEIISILNAGVSYWRYLVPYICGALIIGSLHFYMNHYIVPQGNKKRVDFENIHLGRHSEKTKRNNIHLFVEDNVKISMRYFNSRDTTARDFRIERFDEGQLVEMLHAKRGRYIREEEKWRLNDYVIRTFDGEEEHIYNYQRQQLDTALNLKPLDLYSFHNDKQKLTTPELRVFIDRQKERGRGNIKEFELEAHRRTSDPVTTFILTIIGVSISSRKVRGGMGLHLALGVLIGSLFIYLSKFSLTISNANDMPPILGIWLPNIIFSFVALYLVSRAQK